MKVCVDPGHGMSNRQMGIFDSRATHVENGFLKTRQRTDLAVLKFQGVAVLVERGFIANDADRAKLLDAQIREAIVARIATVTIEHMSGNV